MRVRKDYGTEREWKSRFSWRTFIAYVLIYSANVEASENQFEKNYVAAVVEYSPVILDTPRQTILGNLAQYEKIAHIASQHNVDIIVFPEAGLTTVKIVEGTRSTAKKYLIDVPSPDSLATPCSNTSSDEILQRLSCAAMNNKMYLVANVAEISYCTRSADEQCPEDGAYFYNTNVAFDRRGTVIARYRKYNLFEEKTNNAPSEADLCTFKTDFGVTFGMFVCFDIMFAEPSQRLVREKQVTDVVFSAAWFSELPLLTALSVQAGWAHSLDVNLLASVYDNVAIRAGGSGIYAGRQGPLVTFMPQKTSTKLLIATVPKKTFEHKGDPKAQSSILPIDRPDQAPSDAEMSYICDVSLPNFEVQPLRCEHPARDTSATVRNQFSHQTGSGFSCTVEVTWRNAVIYADEDYENYKMIAYSGERNFGTASRNFVETCGVILCKPKKEPSNCCVADFETSSVEIQSVKIRMKSHNVSSIAIPSALDQAKYPFDVALFNFRGSRVQEEGAELYAAEMDLIKPTKNLSAFAIYKLPADPSSPHAQPK